MSRRLLLFFPSVDRGGCEEYCLAVAKEARRRGYEVEVSFPLVKRTESLWTDFARSGIEAHPWRLGFGIQPGSWNSFDVQRRAALKLLAKVRPDRIWMALPWVDSAVGFLAACGEEGMRGLCVWQLATETVFIPAGQAAAARKSLRRGMQWVAVSQDNRTFVSRSYGVHQSHIHVIHNGLLSHENFSPPSRELQSKYRDEVRKELGLRADACIVVTIARLCLEQKAQDYLLEAIKKLSQLENAYFVWAGDGEDRAYLEQAITDARLRDRVFILGFRSDVARLLVAADLFALPSNLEGAPFTVYEALACGCPIVATSVGGIPEILTHEQDALLILPRDVDGLAHAIYRLMRNETLRRRLSEKGYRTVKKHSAAAMLSESFSLLEASNERSLKQTQLNL